jgi:hypothetical protein
MAGVFPTNVGFQSVNISKKHYDVMSESVNGRTQVRSLNASRRELTVTFAPMTKAEFQPVYSFIDSQNGRSGTFQITVPDPNHATNNMTLTVRLANDVQEYPIGVDSLYNYEVDLIEVV